MAGKSTYQRGLEEASENRKESSHSAHVNGMNKIGGAFSIRSTTTIFAGQNLLH
jgi:hypothetical protein